MIFPSKIRAYFTLSAESARSWVAQIKKAINYRNILDDYEFKNDLGEGKFGQVKLGISRKTNVKVAIKILKKREMNTSDLELARNEIDIMRVCKHPNIIRLLDTYENYKYIYIISEYLSGGDLKDFVHDSKTTFKEEKVVKIIKQIASGVQYLHTLGIMHRDLKPENIMLNSKIFNNFTSVKIMDFGLSKVLGKDEKTCEGFGTICYVAPEILSRKMYDFKSDIWSLGVVAYYVNSRALPFDDEDDDEDKIAKMTLSRNVDFPVKQWSGKTKEAVEIVKLCLNKKQEERINIKQVLEHAWFK